MFDIQRARRETPGCDKVLHFNNAGASLPPACVVETVIKHLRTESEVGAYEAVTRAGNPAEHVYESIATLLGCDRSEVAIVENATRAWDMAFYSLPFHTGDRILTSISEYASNYIACLQVARKFGVQVEAIPNDEHGQVSVTALRKMLNNNDNDSQKVKLIAITHVPTNGGLVNPASEIGQVARQAGIPYLLDACQSVGQMPINVKEIGCDMLSAPGRKYLRAPRGTGFLYIKRELLKQLEPPFLDLHSATWTTPGRFEIRDDARRFESWETNYAAKLGLGAAVDYALAWGIDTIWECVSSLAETLRKRLRETPGVTVHDLGVHRCGIVSMTVDGRSATELQQRLLSENINVTVSPREYTRLDMESRGLTELLRASVHYYNTETEIDRFCQALLRA